jgi:hypothetical protein
MGLTHSWKPIPHNNIEIPRVSNLKLKGMTKWKKCGASRKLLAHGRDLLSEIEV